MSLADSNCIVMLSFVDLLNTPNFNQKSNCFELFVKNLLMWVGMVAVPTVCGKTCYVVYC